MSYSRRDFLKKSGIATGGLLMAASTPSLLFGAPKKFNFNISLAEWSLNKQIFGGEITNLDFPLVAKRDYGIDAVEYVNQFFPDKAEDTAYLGDLKKRTDDNGIKNQLIMIDHEGELSAVDDAARATAVENHYKWIDAAKYLGCHSIRVNLRGSETEKEWISASVDGLGKLGEYGAKNEINVIVENHGGPSSKANLLVEVLEQIGNKWCGTLPDLGNFCIATENGTPWGAPCVEEYDKYKGVKEMMPFAKGVSAKTFDFDEDGNETTIDYMRMMKIVKESGFNGYVGIEYEGSTLSAEAGIKATKKLLKKVRAELS